MSSTVKISISDADHPTIGSMVPSILSRFSTTEILPMMNLTHLRACWELCRLHNNIGFWVIWLPTAWSIAMAYHANTEVTFGAALCRAACYIPLTFGVKSLIMTIDDILDHDVDCLAVRTKYRPIPRGDITLAQAWAFFFCQAVVGIFCAQYFLGDNARHVSSAVWPIFLVYPTCKRWTNLAPIPLGIMFNVGVFMGWCDLLSTPPRWDTLSPVYIGACLWTCTYETIYQHQDKIDDVKIGIYSPALLLGDHTTVVCAVTATGFFSFLAYGGWINGNGVIFYVLLIIAALRLFKALFRIDLDKPDDCKAFFLDTSIVGSIILTGFVVDALVLRLLHNVPL